MARLAGVDLPREKRVEIGLTYIYGIGLTSSQKILKAADVNPDIRVKDLTDEQVNSIRKAIDETMEMCINKEVIRIEIQMKRAQEDITKTKKKDRNLNR